MDVSPRKVSVVFYRTSAGAEVVRDWLKALPDEDRATIGQDLMRVQFRWPVGMPLCRPLGGGLWEVRSDLSRSRIARVFFCFTEAGWSLSTGSSRKPKRRRRPTWIWRASVSGNL